MSLAVNQAIYARLTTENLSAYATCAANRTAMLAMLGKVGRSVELIVNGGFEATFWRDGWYQVPNMGTAAVNSGPPNPHTGSHCAKLVASPVGLGSYLRQTCPVTPGASVTLTFWTKGDGANAGVYRVYDVTNAADIVSERTTGVTAGVYAQVTQTFTVPAGCTSVYLYIGSASVNDAFAFFDDVSMPGKSLDKYSIHRGNVSGAVAVPSIVYRQCGGFGTGVAKGCRIADVFYDFEIWGDTPDATTLETIDGYVESLLDRTHSAQPPKLTLSAGQAFWCERSMEPHLAYDERYMYWVLLSRYHVIEAR
jgi:hypothetical protein